MSNPTTHAESAEYWMAKAKEYETKLMIITRRMEKAESLLREKEMYIGKLETMCVKDILERVGK